MSVTISPDALSRIYRKNMIINLNGYDIDDPAKRDVVRKIKGLQGWETSTDPVCKTYVDIQKHLLNTVIEIQEKINSLKAKSSP